MVPVLYTDARRGRGPTDCSERLLGVRVLAGGRPRRRAGDMPRVAADQEAVESPDAETVLLGEGVLDRVEIRGCRAGGRAGFAPAASIISAHARSLVAGEVVHDDHVAGPAARGRAPARHTSRRRRG